MRTVATIACWLAPVLLSLAFAPWADAATTPSPAYTAREGTNPTITSKVLGFDAWVAAHRAVPDVVVLGSSRAVQFDPRVIKRITGRTAYNTSISDTAAPGLLAMARYVDLRSGGELPKLLVFVDLETFDGRTPFPRMSDYLRWTGLAEQECVGGPATCGTSWKRAASEMARDAHARLEGGRPAAETQRADGRQINGRLQQWEQEGVDLRAIRERRIKQRVASFANGGFERVDPGAAEQVEAIIQLANSRGRHPFLVITTMHPECIRRCGVAGWSDRRAEVLDVFDGMQGDNDFTLLDFSQPGSWGGDAGAFLDEIHIRQSAADSMIRYLANTYGAYGRDGARCPTYKPPDGAARAR